MENGCSWFFLMVVAWRTNCPSVIGVLVPVACNLDLVSLWIQELICTHRLNFFSILLKSGRIICITYHWRILTNTLIWWWWWGKKRRVGGVATAANIYWLSNLILWGRYWYMTPFYRWKSETYKGWMSCLGFETKCDLRAQTPNHCSD